MSNPIVAVNPPVPRSAPQRNALRNGNRSGATKTSNAEYQARFRQKRDAELAGYRRKAQDLVDALSSAVEAAGCQGLTNHLPHDPVEALAELAIRLEGKKLIVAKREGRKQ